VKRTPAAALVPLLLLSLLTFLPGAALAARDRGKDKAKDKEKTEGRLSASTFSGLALRGIGPAMTSGRIVDLAIHPSDKATWYVAVAAGGVWKTTNAGTTWKPLFDSQGSYSIGCVTVDPNDPKVVWVGTGENNSQRSVGFGDGVYKSVDGGTTWENVGLKTSEHIGKILVDPRESDTVYVAAQGPLWSAGGERGLYKTTDGGKTWKAVLTISENTGVSDVVMDPRDPDVLIASAYQRRRHVWTVINGGPEAAIYKSTDAGASWKKMTAGLPKVDLGRIGLAISPADPDTVYAIVEAANGEGGFFRSTDGGSNWEKRSDYTSGSGQYYQELFPDPEVVGRVYSVDVFLQVTDDGGATFRNAGEKNKHVDNHVVWIDLDRTDHLLVGCDGGLYESWDRGATWDFKPNLSVAQFYRVETDNDRPFYNVYGGTQDNYSLAGPSHTTSINGITNGDWYVTNGGDGFETVVDPEDPNILYAQSQHAGIVRFDKRNGEVVDIQPQPGKGEDALRFNWDSPLILSPHSRTRLYLAAQRLYRSDDRGDSWRPISADLTRQIDRNKLKVMGKVWSIDAVAKNASTSVYGNIVALAESPVQEDLLVLGTDDGLIQVTENAGGQWRKVERFPGVPDNTYVSSVVASRHAPRTLYAAFENHKMGDFKPYVLRSTDLGATWTSIVGDLPKRGPVLALAEDPVRPELLFAGTEFGVFFTLDGGRRWVQLTGNMPTISVRDIDIQERENDLVLATFGRGFYILDDYTPLRLTRPETLEQEAVLFPVKQAWMYMERYPLGLPDKGFQGESFFTAPNRPFGAVFTVYLRDELKNRKQRRRDAEKKLDEERGVLVYPSKEDIRAELRERDPALLLTVKDEDGNVVRRLTAPAKAGFQRVSWDLRLPAPNPTNLGPPSTNPYNPPPTGPMVAPGKFTVSLAKEIDGQVTPLGEAQTFEAVPLGLATLAAQDRPALVDFQKKVSRLQRAVLGATSAIAEAQERIGYLRRALLDTPAADPAFTADLDAIEARLSDLDEELNGDATSGVLREASTPAITSRVNQIVSGAWTSTAAPTRTHQDNYAVAAADFAPVLERLRQVIEVDLQGLENRMEAAGAPWTPGRLPSWKPEP
jgi:photosystem II stability/assembly factor-like uncharacterized protein